MAVLEKNPNGTINISENVLAVLAGAAVESCAGIVGMAGGKMMDGINELLRRDNYGRGASVEVIDNPQGGPNGLRVQIRVIVEYGINITAMANSAIEMVTYHLNRQTGMPVAGVEVLVSGVRV
ncbi:MAG: Asp23/Gls24 family envelope stress response protein [Clostridia bacterium]|nr:Asp23/Gls24 family envelope stress response protein [Clostridia bacterium]